MAPISKKTPKNIQLATRDTPWTTMLPPMRVAPRVYFVGNRFVGSYLIDTSEGLAIIDTTVFETTWMLIESIYQLGFDPKNIKAILISHSHVDHDGGARCIQAICGAPIYESREDDEWRARPEADMRDSGYKFMPYTVDRYYDDNTPIVMGDVTIRTRLSAGHTPGCTSFFVDMPDENGNKITWAMHGGVGLNTMNAEYLNKVHLPLSLQQDFLRGCEEMKREHVDICTPSHPSHSNMLEIAPEDHMDYRPFVDDTKWAAFLDERAESLHKSILTGKDG